MNGRVGDRIDGLGGDDQLTGARGRDTLRGGSGRGAPVRRRGGVRALRRVDVQVQSSYRCNGPYSGRSGLPGSFFRTWL